MFLIMYKQGLMLLIIYLKQLNNLKLNSLISSIVYAALRYA